MYLYLLLNNRYGEGLLRSLKKSFRTRIKIPIMEKINVDGESMNKAPLDVTILCMIENESFTVSALKNTREKEKYRKVYALPPRMFTKEGKCDRNRFLVFFVRNSIARINPWKKPKNMKFQLAPCQNPIRRNVNKVVTR